MDRHQSAQIRIGEHVERGGAREHAQRVHRHIAPKLGPDIAADILTDDKLHGGFAERVRQRPHARRARSVRLTQDQPVLALHRDHSGLRRPRACMHHATDDTPRRNSARDRTVRIDRRQGEAFMHHARHMEIPPRDSVERGDDHRVRAAQRRDGGRHCRHRLSLHRRDDAILRAQLRWIVRRLQAMDRFGPAAPDTQAIRAQRRQRLIAGKKRDVMPGFREHASDPSADGARADDADLHLMLASIILTTYTIRRTM
ncbi:MAG TPA: hypothetical protein VGF56_02090 [Rhizomicrobium sp.]|jgi:hypothetical protein